MYIVPTVCSYEKNSFVRLSYLVKEAAEVKEPCWVCTKIPPDVHRGLSFTPWPLKEANFTEKAPKDQEIITKHPKKEREPLQVTLKKGEWCVEKAIFISTFQLVAKDVGTSMCKIYFNGTVFSNILMPKTINIIKNPTELEQQLDPMVPRKGIYWVCGTWAYRFLPQNWVGSCYPAWFIPPSSKRLCQKGDFVTIDRF